MAIYSSSQLPSSSVLPSSSHRLPTVSATEALQALQDNAPSPLGTGISHLDTLLASRITSDGAITGPSTAKLGLVRGSVTEVWGPSGSGKTALAMCIAASALTSGGSVVWIDAATPLVPHRLLSTLQQPSHSPKLANFHHLPLPTLSHILVLLSRPPSSVITSPPSLLVLENIHASLDIAYPRYTASTTGGPGAQEARRWASGRRFAVLGHIGAELRRWAATYGCAVVVTTGAVTRGRGAGERAVLAPAIGGVEWESHVANRMVLFRDFDQGRRGTSDNDTKDGRKNEPKKVSGGRYAGVTKLAGTRLVHGDGDVGVVVPFAIGEEGIVDNSARSDGDMNSKDGRRASSGADLPLPTAKLVSPVKPKPSKRKYDEVADSEDEAGSEYGWDEENEIAAEGLIDEEDLFTAGGDAVVAQTEAKEEDESLFTV